MKTKKLVCGCGKKMGHHSYPSMGSNWKPNDIGSIKLLKAVFQHLFDKLNQFEVAPYEAKEVYKWAKNDKGWISHFESIFEYDHDVIRNIIIKKCEKHLQ